MAGTEVSHIPDSIESPQESSQYHDLRETFGDVKGYEEFEKETLPSLTDLSIKNKLISVLLANKANPDLQKYIGGRRGGFPKSELKARELIEKFDPQIRAAILETVVQGEKGVAQEYEVQAQENEVQAQENEVQAQENEVQKQKRETIRTHLENLDRLGVINIKQDFAGVDIQGDFDVTRVSSIINQNAVKYLQAAQKKSPGTFIQTYDTLKALDSVEGIDIAVSLQEFEAEYQRSIHIIENPRISDGDLEIAEIALGDSSISKIEGDRIYGENGEVVDVSGDTPTLSLEGQDGMTLEVGNIETPDTRKGEKEISGLETAIGGLKEKIAKNEKILETYVLGVDASLVSNEVQTDSYFTALLQVGVDRKFIETLDEKDIFGTALLNALGDYIDSQNTDYKSDIAKFERQVGILKSRMETQSMLASEKIRIQKERVEASAKFLERMGVSKAISRLKEIFALISPANPLTLPNGNIITRMNLSTMELEGSFSPSLGEAGAKDPNTQKILSQVLNIALFGTPDEPIQIAASGNIFFGQVGENKRISEVEDTGVFQRKIDAIVGDPAFGVQVRKNLWGKV